MNRLQQTGKALGSEVVLTVVAVQNSKIDAIFKKMWQQIQDFEQRFSRFKTDSELSIFNAFAGGHVAVSPEFNALLTTSYSMARTTNGLYNPFILPALQRAGYKGSWPTPDIADSKLDYVDRKVADWHDIEISDSWAMIPSNAAIDFGGIGKGFLLDELGESLHAQGIQNFWLSLGGDILCAGFDAPGTPWKIAIQDSRHEQVTATFVTNDGKTMAVATSGVTKRKGVGESGGWHHIIDPRTNAPANTDVLTATVCAMSATEADVYAKCLVVTGSTEAKEFCHTIGQTNAYLQIAATEGSVSALPIGTVWSQ